MASTSDLMSLLSNVIDALKTRLKELYLLYKYRGIIAFEKYWFKTKNDSICCLAKPVYDSFTPLILHYRFCPLCKYSCILIRYVSFKLLGVQAEACPHPLGQRLNLWYLKMQIQAHTFTSLLIVKILLISKYTMVHMLFKLITEQVL